MEAILPHEIIYDTPRSVPVADIVESLLGTLQLSREIGPLLEQLIPGLEVKGITVSVREISQKSPLREAFAFGLVALFQDKLGEDMPKIIHDLFGVDVPHEYHNLVSLVFIVLIFFSGQFVFDKVGKLTERRRLRREFNGLVTEISKMLDKSEEAIKKLIRDRYGSVRIRPLISASARVLLPSKNQGNAPMSINGRALPKGLISEFPSRAQIVEDEPRPLSEPLENVEIRLHAQDVDRNKQGWAAVVPTLSSKRIPMHLYPPIEPTDIYRKAVVHGDLLVESRLNEKGEMEPVRIHLIRLRD